MFIEDKFEDILGLWKEIQSLLNAEPIRSFIVVCTASFPYFSQEYKHAFVTSSPFGFQCFLLLRGFFFSDQE